jgi:capsid protein
LRGIPEITPALPLYAILRRYTLATLGAAEVAAMLAMFLKTNSSAIDPAEVDPWAALELNRNALTTLPDGWDVSQLRAEQPTTTYDTFTRAIIREIARCLDMPFNVAAGDSSDSNYASGRLDHQTWRRAVDIDRASLQCVALDRIFAAWLDEALLVPGLLAGLPPIASLKHEWHWTPFEHVDPLKEANAAITLLGSGLLSIPTYYAGQGKDWQDELAKQAACLGLTFDEYRVELRKKLLAVPGAAMATSANAEGGDNAA